MSKPSSVQLCTQEMFGQLQNILVSFRQAAPQLGLNDEEKTRVVVAAAANFINVIMHELIDPSKWDEVGSAIVKFAVNNKPMVKTEGAHN